MSRHSASGARWKRVRAQLLAQSDVCWICEHEGATEADHVIRLADGGARLDPANLRPAHGVTGCPICGRKCNQERNRRPRTRQQTPQPSRRW